MRVARAEALATDTAPGSDHILLGILRTDSDAARALRSEGVSLPTALDCVRSTNGSRASGNDVSCIRRILRRAASAALARGDRELDLDQLLLAALEAPDGGARRTLRALAVEPAAVEARLRRRSPRDGRRCVAA